MRAVEERTFTTHDGVALFYRHWPAASAKPKGAILLFHRGHEHSGRMAHLAEELDLPEFAVFAWDARLEALAKANSILGQFHRVRRAQVEAGKAPTVKDSLAAMQE